MLQPICLELSEIFYCSIEDSRKRTERELEKRTESFEAPIVIQTLIAASRGFGIFFILRLIKQTSS